MANPKNTQTMSNTDHDGGHGSFATGFLLGVVVGAVGIWTTQNKEGKKVLEFLKQELHSTLGEELGDRLPSVLQPSAPPSAPGKKFPKFTAKRKTS